MATYTGSPRTWVAGETLTAALMNSDVRDPLAALLGSANDYVPTLSGFTAGNGAFVGKYVRAGKLVLFYASFTFGSTSAAATTTPALSVPVTGTGVHYTGFARFTDASTGNVYEAGWRITTSGITTYTYGGTTAIQAVCTTTSPFTWTTGDQIIVGGIYEAA